MDVSVLPKGFKVPKNVPKGSGKNGDKGDPKNKEPKQEPTPGPKTDPVKTDPVKSDDPPKTSIDSCSLQKRGGKGCDPTKTSSSGPGPTQISTVTSSDPYPKVNVITETCKQASYSQACAHYYSAIKNYPDKIESRFTCYDSMKGEGRKKFSATNDWRNQHKNSVWQSYTMPDYKFKNEIVTIPDVKWMNGPPHTFSNPVRNHINS